MFTTLIKSKKSVIKKILRTQFKNYNTNKHHRKFKKNIDLPVFRDG
jgi:hypothetical protein